VSATRLVSLGSFTVPAGAAGYLWQQAHHAGGDAGLGVLVALLLPMWPLILLTVVYGLPALPGLLVPRRWRCWWRQGHDRPHIPRVLRRAVYASDRWACRHCGSRDDLQLDHVFPWSLGGTSSLWNLVTLCGRCNRAKSNYWRWRDGREYIGPWCTRPDLAAVILACERRARWYPWRWLLAAVTL